MKGCVEYNLDLYDKLLEVLRKITIRITFQITADVIKIEMTPSMLLSYNTRLRTE